MKNFKAWKSDKINGWIDINKQCPEMPTNFYILVDPSESYQQIQGFGGAFNELGWKAIQSLNENQQDLLMEALFGQDGCKFKLCRTPMGASDFAIDAFSYNDSNGDYEMVNFSTARDNKYLIPYIKEAQKYNPDLEVCGCPWSPPAWMKTTGKMCAGGELLDTPQNLKAYALYFIKYLEEYLKKDIPLTAICIQNEIDVVNVYPTSTMTPELMQKFLRAYLIPALVSNQGNPFDIDVWAGTIRDVKGYADIVIGDPVVNQFVNGITYQYSSPGTVKDSYIKHPNKVLYHSESPCHNGANSWVEAKEIFNDIIDYLENGCVNYTYWNMVLDETGLSSWNWKQNSMITVDCTKGKVLYNHEFYVMKHFSNCVLPGAKRIKLDGDFPGRKIGFMNKDGSIALCILNDSDSSSNLEIIHNGECISVCLEPDSIYTLLIAPTL